MIVTADIALQELEQTASKLNSRRMQTWADALRRRIHDLERTLEQKREEEKGRE